MLTLPLLNLPLRTRHYRGAAQVWDEIRRCWVILTPEEHVRQSVLHHLLHEMNYPRALMAVERGVSFGHTTLRFDAVVFQRRDTRPWMLIECKSPDVPIADDTLQQLLRYHGRLPSCSYWLLSNGHQSFCADCSTNGSLHWLSSLPQYQP